MSRPPVVLRDSRLATRESGVGNPDSRPGAVANLPLRVGVVPVVSTADSPAVGLAGSSLLAPPAGEVSEGRVRVENVVLEPPARADVALHSPDPAPRTSSSDNCLTPGVRSSSEAANVNDETIPDETAERPRVRFLHGARPNGAHCWAGFTTFEELLVQIERLGPSVSDVDVTWDVTTSTRTDR